MRTKAAIPVVVCCVLAACGARSRQSDTDAPSNGSAIIIRSAEISGNVLQAMRTKIPSIRISSTAGCPQIAFRGNVSLHNQPNPTVYIDGTLIADTCALQSVSATELDRVEVYTSGDTPYASIRRNPAGVIIIYRRRE